MSVYDEGWLAFYKGISAYDNPYSPENFYSDFSIEGKLPEFLASVEEKLLDELGDLTQKGQNELDTVATNLKYFSEEELNRIIKNDLDLFGHKYKEWARGHQDAASRNFSYDYSTVPPKQGIVKNG